MKVEFEWGIAQAPNGSYIVHERLVGTDLCKTYNVPNLALAEGVVKIRRAFVHRTITTRSEAVQIFEPRPQLEALNVLQRKGHLDS